jgi:hypothetical protein
MILDRIELQRATREGSIKSGSIIRLDANTLVGIEEKDWLVLDRIMHGLGPTMWARGFFASAVVLPAAPATELP